MRAFCKVPVLLLFACSLTTASYAQPQRFRFEHLTAADGLPFNNPEALLQDHLGLLWIGTDRWLVRYDGHAMTRYSLMDGGHEGVARVMALQEDVQGNIWIATWHGLKRFDRASEEITSYRHEEDDANSLSGDRVLFVHEDGQGSLWFVTADSTVDVMVRDWPSKGYLDRYDPESGIFTRYRHAPQDTTSLGHDMISMTLSGSVWFFAVFEDSRSRMWFGTDGGGLNRYDPDSNAFVRYGRNQGLSSEYVTSICEDRDGWLWIGTDGGGLDRLDGDTGAITNYRHDKDDAASLWDDRIIRLFADREGMLWVTTRAGLNRYDPRDDTFARYQLAYDDPVTPGPEVASAWLEDSRGDLWLAHGSPESPYGATLYYYDRRNDTFTHYREDRNDPGSPSLGGIGITSILEDRSGVLWIGTWRGYLNKLTRSSQKFRVFEHDPGDENSLGDNMVTALFEDRDGILWIGTGHGLDRFDPSTETFEHFRHEENNPRSLLNEWVEEIAVDHGGGLWVGTWNGGLDRFDPQAETFEHYTHEAADPGSLADNDIRRIYEAPSEPGILWIGTEAGGLDRFDTRTGRVAHNFRHSLNDPGSIHTNMIESIYEAPSEPGVLWIGGEGKGFSRYDIAEDSMERYTLARDADPEGTGSANIMAFMEDQAGQLWLIPYNDGLVRFERGTGNFRYFTTTNSDLSSDATRSLELDAHGHLWIGTESGLTRFDPDTEQFRTYDTSDGLPSNTFIDGVSHRGQSGTLYFGTVHGFIAFDPDVVEGADNPHPPPVVLTVFRLGEDAVSVGPDAPLSAPISVAEAGRLRHRQNDFTVEYAALDFNRPEKNQYKYRLEPYDKVWREVGTLRQATYTNMAPGAYTFRVIASNNDGVWNEEGASLHITILPPWWRSWWAYALYALLLVGAVVGAYRVQRGRLLRKAEVEQTRLRAEAAELQARAMEAENERNHVEVEKARELETAYHTLKTTQQQLVQSEKLASLGQLTSGIAHELKNPLNFVNNFAEVNEELARELSEELEAHKDRRIAEVLDDLDDLVSGIKVNTVQITKHGRRADAIVQSMMEHARGGAGERYEVGVNKLVNEYVDLSFQAMQVQLPDLEVKIERAYDEAVGAVEMAPQEVGRALLNILNNAFEAVHGRAQAADESYTPTVQVSTRLLDGRVEIRVCDNGGGIPTEIKDRIFEPFFTTKPTGGGSTGLGLSLSYDIVTQGHSGTLQVESAEGEGATFVITLPGV